MASAPLTRAVRQSVRDPHLRRRLSTAVGALAVALWLPTALAQGSAVDISESERVSGDGSAVEAAAEATETVYFGFAESALDAAAREPLESIVARIGEDDALRVRIAAHTDNRGWSLGNVELSRLRARAVARALVEQGIDIERISARAYGESMPVAPNATAEGRRRNRRVEISLLR